MSSYGAVPLDPLHLTPTASLNRVPFVAAPAVRMPPEYEGRSAFSLLGADALAGLITDHRRALDLGTEEIASGSLSFALRARLSSPDPAVSATALNIVSDYSRRLGYLIAILKRGDAESRAARSEWDESYWEHWGRIERVYLGGGLAWPEICDAAGGVVRQLSPGIEVSRSPFPAHRALLGAARSLHMQDGCAIVLDFGQTATKRAVAFYQAGHLASMTELQPVPTSRFQGLDYVRWIVHVTASSLSTGVTTAGICVSSYLDEEGQPARYAAGGRFGGIDDEIPRLGDWLTREVSLAAGRVVGVSLFHDASAAGVGLSPSPSAAMIMLGTALGVGFPRACVGSLRPLAPDFSFVEARLGP